MTRIAVIGLVGESVFLGVDHHHAEGETLHAESIHREWGGKGYNQAVAAARFGAEVAFLGAASGSDGDAIIAAARADGIRAVIAKKSVATAYGVIITDKVGDNRVTVFGGAALDQSDVGCFAREIEAADLLLINNEVPEGVNVEAVKIAKAAGVKIVYNPAPAREICEYLLTNTDIFIPNEQESEALGERDNVIVTLGARGAYIRWMDAAVPAFAPAAVVDTTGAGDTFTGAFSVAFAEGKDTLDAVRLASAASSIEVSRRFVMAAIPKRAEAEALLGGIKVY